MIMMKLSWFVLLSSSLVVFAILDFAAAKGSVFTRGDFPSPPHMVFGAATSAFQYDGAAFEDGKTPCIWDTSSHSADVQLMVDTGLEAYIFSISWSRLLPSGRGNINPKALEYYNNLINELIRNGIEPHVILVHYDPPQVLEDEYGGWISQNMVKDFTAYADVCFREFGDRIRHWITVNEANMFALGAYDKGRIPPQSCSFPYGNCFAGNSSVKPYIVAHHFLLAHASAARLYKTKYQASQHGFIGINLLAYGTIPYTNTSEDVIATKRYNDFFVGWFLDPLMFGDYPLIMKKNAATRIPALNKKESELIKGSADFIGVNFYYTVYVMDKSRSLENDNKDYFGDMAAEYVFHPKDTLPDPTLLSELPVKPSGLVQLLEYFKQFYGNPTIYIHENGHVTPKNTTFNDAQGVKYMKGYIGALLDAIRNGSNVKGYFYWSFMDLVELIDEETLFGLYYVDLDSKDLTRYPKLSALRNGSNAVGYFCWSFLDLYVVAYDNEASYSLYHVDFDEKDLARPSKLDGQWYANFLKGNNMRSQASCCVPGPHMPKNCETEMPGNIKCRLANCHRQCAMFRSNSSARCAYQRELNMHICKCLHTCP